MCRLIVFDCVSIGTSSVNSDQASMYTCSLVSVFCSRQFSVKQLKFEIYIILCQYSQHSFLKGSEIKLNLVKLTFPTAIFSHQVMGMLSKKCEVWKIYHTEYGLFLITDWLKSKGSGRVMG